MPGRLAAKITGATISGLLVIAAMTIVGMAVIGMAGVASADETVAASSAMLYSAAGQSGPNAGGIHYVDWYQGQEGKWHRGPNNKWEWRGNKGNQWYWGQQGHWYKERNGWQFGSDGLVCNNNGRDCRRGRYLPANGQGMVNRQNPNLYWACDSNGHNCHWARRPR